MSENLDKQISRNGITKRIAEIDEAMTKPDFWNNKQKAQDMIREREELLAAAEGGSAYDKGGAVLNVFAGAGGSDAEDFVRMLLEMYMKFFERQGWSVSLLDDSPNEHGGYKNVSVEVEGKGVYGMMKNESGVHRLVRQSPFSSKDLRHTSFVLVEFLPVFKKLPSDVELDPADIRVELSKSGGPGGQNVNKRETAVRVVHEPTNISAHVTNQRSQAQNKEKAMEIVAAKLYTKMIEDQKRKERGLSVSKTTEIEWGNQIRSYVLHPYKMVKDHRTGVETGNTDAVLKDGALEEFLEAEKTL